LVQHRKWLAAVDHVILGDDLEPIDDGVILQNVAIVRNSEANSNAVFSEGVKSIRRHTKFLQFRNEVKSGHEGRDKPTLWLVGWLCDLGWVGAIGSAAALALARVLALAAVVASLTTALPLAVVLAFAGMFVTLLIIGEEEAAA
jgi:hypothetical protein